MKYYIFITIALLILVSSCTKDMTSAEVDNDLTIYDYQPESYILQIPEGFPQMVIPADNPLTVGGVSLGRHLFYDPILSVDSTQSCSSCHLQEANFTDNLAVSTGVDGIAGRRSSMTLLNVGFHNTGLFWDGSVMTLEEQALLPIEDPIELHDSWPNVERKLQRHSMYPKMFREAFGIEEKQDITRELAVKAIAQFERTLISSGESKYDRVIAGEAVFTDQELDGFEIFFDINEDQSQHAECGHCHNAPLFTTNEYFNNGIDAVIAIDDFADLARGQVTGRRFDNGAFKVPTLRNIEASAPFMHDGRFVNLDEVIDHYATGGNPADNLGAVLRPLAITDTNRAALIAFISTLRDDAFLQNSAFSSPF